VRLFILILFLVSNYSFAQVKYGERITSKFFEKKVWNSFEETYEFETNGWYTMSILPQEDYYMVSFNGEESSKVWWEYSKQNEYGNDVYFIENGNKIIFDYDDQEIILYSDSDGSRYKTLVVFSKLEVD
jgi:hypothetical protein